MERWRSLRVSVMQIQYLVDASRRVVQTGTLSFTSRGRRWL
ncbi:Hypothetical protein A7982_01639 [Minicystis rosea]|nr:Hypothetical protein A7982_01639 [Minicystis rosea]